MAKTSMQYIKEAARKLKDSKLQRLGGAKTQEIFKGVMQTVGLETVEEVYLFVSHFDLTCMDRSSNLCDLAIYFECSYLDMMEYVPTLNSLERKGLLVRRGSREENIIRQNFVVNDSVMAAVIENQHVKIRDVKVSDIQIDKYGFCKRIGEKAENEEVMTDDLVFFTEKLEKGNPCLCFIQELKKNVLSIMDRILFYDMCYDNFKSDAQGMSEIGTTLKDIYTNMHQRILVRKSIVEQEHSLIQLGLIRVEEDNDNYFILTDKGKKLYYGGDLLAFEKSYKCNDIYDFVDSLYDFFHFSRNYDSNSVRSHYIVSHTLKKYESGNKHIPAVESIRHTIANDYDRLLFYFIGHNLVDDDSSSLSNEVKTLYPRQKRRIILNKFKDKCNNLQKQGLVEIEKQSSLFGEDTRLIMTDLGKEKLLGEDAALYINDTSNKQLLSCDKISEKKLFFTGELEEQLSLLRKSLTEQSYKGLCARLEVNKLPKGIAVLLYGEPGTGKTESVMQIAKATGRPIMHVDISATKTCWFGESEKLIKKVFTDYRTLCEKNNIKPILLFNEADAVFSKRKNVNSGNVAQTENAIQNIILEEMENLDGILIATTNLADNLDGAFERRFLFKIRFDKPTIEAKRNIWMNKLSSLSLEEAETLASNYDFSGGQIDNIARKAFIQEVINGVKPTINSLVKLCGEEKISKNNFNRIGFC
jgi:hypothetical protein